MTVELIHPRVCCLLHNWNLRATQVEHLVSNVFVAYFVHTASWPMLNVFVLLEHYGRKVNAEASFVSLTLLYCLCQHKGLIAAHTVVLSNLIMYLSWLVRFLFLCFPSSGVSMPFINTSLWSSVFNVYGCLRHRKHRKTAKTAIEVL